MIDDDDNDEWRWWHLSGGCRAQQLLLPNCLFRHFTTMQCNVMQCWNAMHCATLNRSEMNLQGTIQTLHSADCNALFRYSTDQTALQCLVQHCSDTPLPSMYHSFTPPQGCNALFRHSTACTVLLFIELEFIALVAYTTLHLLLRYVQLQRVASMLVKQWHACK